MGSKESCLHSDISKLNFNDLNSITPHSAKQGLRIQNAIAEETELREKRRKEDLDHYRIVEENLSEISNNTASIKDVLEILRNISLSQDETKVLVEGIVELAKAKTVEDAEKISTGIIGKIQGMGSTIDSMESIIKVLKLIKAALPPLLLL